jgi:hypothetical protein
MVIYLFDFKWNAQKSPATAGLLLDEQIPELRRQ